MSKVDMKVFEDFREAMGMDDKSMDNFIYNCATGDIGYSSPDLVWPERNGRDWNDPTWTSETDAYSAAQNKAEEEYFAQFGYEHLDQSGGGEGGSEYCYGVFKLGENTYKAEYSYYSHHGHDYDDIENTLQIVKPVQKTVTVYE